MHQDTSNTNGNSRLFDMDDLAFLAGGGADREVIAEAVSDLVKAITNVKKIAIAGNKRTIIADTLSADYDITLVNPPGSDAPQVSGVNAIETDLDKMHGVFLNDSFDVIICDSLQAAAIMPSLAAISYCGRKYIIAAVKTNDFKDNLLYFEDFAERFREFSKIITYIPLDNDNTRVYLLEKFGFKSNDLNFYLNLLINKDDIETDPIYDTKENNESEFELENEAADIETKHDYDYPDNDNGPKPLFSVIVPTYNQAQYLPESLESLFAQTFEEWEAVVVDDGSTDDTADVMKEYALRDRRVRCFHKQNGGVSSALNEGIKKARGEWICWLSSDDLFEPEALQVFYENIHKTPQIRFFHSHYYIYNETTGQKEAPEPGRYALMPTPEFQVITFLMNNYVHGISIAVHKSVFDELGLFDGRYLFAQDAEMWLRITSRYQSRFINKRTCITRVHGEAGTVAFPEGGDYDMMRILLEFINTHNLEQMFPLFDFTNADHIVNALQRAIQTVLYPGTFMFKGIGPNPALIEKVHEWVAYYCPPPLRSHLESQLREISRQIDSAGLNAAMTAAFEKLGRFLSEPFIYKPYNPLNCLSDAMTRCENDGSHDKAGKIKTYFEKLSKKNLLKDNPQPLVSVIIPTYNRHDMLRKAIQSVLDQSYGNIEIIVVNDAGSDCTPVINELNKSGRIRYISHHTNKDRSAARNTGMKAANGKYIAYLDDDDIFYTNHIETLVNYLETHEEKIAYTDAVRAHQIREGSEYVTVKKDIPYSLDFNNDRILSGNFIPILCIIHEKSCTDDVGKFDESLKSHEDWDLLIRLSRKYTLKHLKTVTCEFSWREDGSSTTSKSKRDFYNTNKLIYERYHEYAKDKPEVLRLQNNQMEYLQRQMAALGELRPDPVFSIIIPVHNNLDFTKVCLDSVFETCGAFETEVIVVDNASSDDTKKYLEGTQSIHSNLIIITNDENLSFSKICNQGAEAAAGKYLIFLNNDTKAMPGWLEALELEFRENPDTTAQGVKLLYENGRIQHAGMVFGARPGRTEEPYHAYLLADPNAPLVNRRRAVQFATAACLAIRTEVFRQVNGFDEAYIFGWEDTDLCMKINTAGGKIIYNPSAVLYHFESVTKKFREQKGEDMLSPVSGRELANRQRFFEKWGKTVKKDADAFYAEDGLKIEGNSLVPISRPATTGSDGQRSFTSFSPIFWNRDYKNASAVLIKITPAIGDALFITALVADMKSKYPNLKIYISAKDYLLDLFRGHPALEAMAVAGSADEARMEKAADIIVDYNNIIARMPEYYNKLSFMDIIGNIAGIKFEKRDLVYSVEDSERLKAESTIKPYLRGGNLIGLHFNTNKDTRRSYPHGSRLIRDLRVMMPDAAFVHFGTSSLEGVSNTSVYDCAAYNVSLRDQIALASLCDSFITIDSAFFHIGHNLFNKPVMLIAGLTNPNLIGVPSKGFAYVRNQNLDCLSCYWQKQCRTECMNELQPIAVASAFFSYLNGEYHYISSDYKPEREIEIPDGTNYEEFLWKHFIESRTSGGFILKDKNNLLPEYASNWNGISLRKAESTKTHTEKDGIMPQDIHETKQSTDSKTNAPGEGFGEVLKPSSGMLDGFDFGDGTANKNNVKEQMPLPEKSINVVWEGSQFVYHSLALINREHCTNIIDSGLAELTIIPYENDQFEPYGNEKYEKLLRHDLRFKQLSANKKLPYAWIRHQWPPKFEAPQGAKWIIMQPWEYSTTRKDFAELLNKADEVWTPSNYSRQCFINSGVDFNKVQVVPNGIDPELFKPSGSRYPLDTRKKIKFLFVGGTIFRKGSDVLLKSYAGAFTNHDDVCLVIKDMGGDTFYRGQTAKTQIDAMRANPSAPEVIYLDHNMTEEEMASLYRACDVFVSPYRGEGFSLPALEAMACGLPVVVTKGGSTDDFVDPETGWFISATKRSIGSVIDNHPLAGEAFVLEPDSDELTAILKDIYGKPSILVSTGIKAAYTARTKWTWKRATIKMFSRLDVLYGTEMAAQAEKLLLPSPEDAMIHLGAAEYELDNGEFASAATNYNKALESGTLTERYITHVLHRLAQIQILLGDTDNAANYLNKIENIIGSHPDTHYLRSAIAARNEEWEKSLTSLTAIFDNWKEWKYAGTLGYGLDDLLCDTAETMLSMEDAESALTLFGEALKINGTSSRACLGSAKCFITAGANEEARNMLDWAIQLDPSSTEAQALMQEIDS